MKTTLTQIHHLKLSWSISRGRDTYGYNIARLEDSRTGKRYKTCGGGYDMVGTIFADWLSDTYQQELLDIKSMSHYVFDYPAPLYVKPINFLYGMRYDCVKDSVTLDGGCGLESMLKIAEAIGLEIEREYVKTGKKRGQTIGYFAQMNR